MQASNIPSHRKHLYFYTLLIVGTVFVANLKLSWPKSAANSGASTRSQEVNKLANGLFQ